MLRDQVIQAVIDQSNRNQDQWGGIAHDDIDTGEMYTSFCECPCVELADEDENDTYFDDEE
jgi:hypothetical protein